MKSKTTLYFASSIAAIAGLLFGFDTGIISGALLFIRHQFDLDAVASGAVVSCVLLGAMIGAALSGRLTDLLGRRAIVLVISAVFIVGALASSLSTGFITLLVSRVIIGLAIGVGSYSAPLYISELAPVKQRGALVTLNQLAITVGILMSYLINYCFASAGNWRAMFAIGIIPAILLAVGMFFLPESPRWLVVRGRIDEAKKALSRVREISEVEEEVASIVRSVQDHQSISWKKAFAPWVRPVLLLGVLLSFLQQVSGINTVIYYAPVIFKMAGFHSNTTSILATVGVGVMNVLFTIFSIWAVDRLGRRKLLLSGMLGIVICLGVIAYAFHAKNLSVDLKWITLAGLFVYIACFAFSLGAMLWLLVSEIFPLEVRGAAMGIAVAMCWLSNLAVSFSFLPMTKALGMSDTFMIFAVITTIGLVYCYFYTPETRGVSLESIEEHLKARKPLREL